MARKTKSELEEGNYIAYTDEPYTVVDAGSGGGDGEGGGNLGKCSFTITIDKEVANPTVFNGLIKLNDEQLSGFANRALSDDEIPVPRLDVEADAFSLLNVPLNLAGTSVASSGGAGFIDAQTLIDGDVTTGLFYTPTPAFNGTQFVITPME
jgi:hypothetical protein